ncbi:MAG: division/cell wall cluster transcriptional repressor MraZ [Clostridia bacterium]
MRERGGGKMYEDFAGTFEHGLDSKGRVIIPVCFRDRLGDHFTIALNSDSSALALYPLAKWEQMKERLSQVRSTDQMAMQYVRYILGNAYTANDMDAQGRILLPTKLRNKVQLSREIVFVGMTEHIEVWDAARYAEQEMAAEANIAALLAHMDATY